MKILYEEKNTFFFWLCLAILIFFTVVVSVGQAPFFVYLIILAGLAVITGLTLGTSFILTDKNIIMRIFFIKSIIAYKDVKKVEFAEPTFQSAVKSVKINNIPVYGGSRRRRTAIKTESGEIIEPNLSFTYGMRSGVALFLKNKRIIFVASKNAPKIKKIIKNEIA